MKKIVVVLLVCGILCAKVCSAEDKDEFFSKLLKTAVSPIDSILGATTELDKIVVTPSRFEEKLGSSSCSISVVDSDDIDRQKLDTLKGTLRDQIGLDVVQKGAFQGQTSLFTRGADSNKTVIFVDGIKAYDPISPNGAYDLAHLTLDNVSSVEILRGAQSTLYGSDAMAGVINIASKKAEDTYVNGWFEGGQLYTYSENLELGSVANGFHYSASASQLCTKGISQLQAKNNNPEHDPYERTAVAARVDYDIADWASVGATMRYTNARFEYDDTIDDDNLVGRYRETFFTLYGEHTILEHWKHSLRLGWMETIRRNFDDPPPAGDYQRSNYLGKFFKLDYNHVIDFREIDTVVLGYDYTEEIGDSYNDYGPGAVYDMPKASSREGDFYVENRLNIGDRLTSTQGFRVAHHSQAGTFSTYRFDASYLFVTGTKVRGLIATGYRAPGLFQLFTPRDPYMGAGGNPNLKPEKNFSYEYGADQYIFGDKLIMSATYFFAIYKDIIDAVETAPWFYDDYKNVGKQSMHGIELSAKASPLKNLTIRGGYTYQKTKNIQTGRELLRRPENKFFIEWHWEIVPKLSMDCRLRYNGPQVESDLTLSKGKEYTVVDMILNYDISKNFSVYSKILNLFDAHYEEAIGYGTLPFTAYGGVKVKF